MFHSFVYYKAFIDLYIPPFKFDMIVLLTTFLKSSVYILIVFKAHTPHTFLTPFKYFYSHIFSWTPHIFSYGEHGLLFVTKVLMHLCMTYVFASPPPSQARVVETGRRGCGVPRRPTTTTGAPLETWRCLDVCKESWRRLLGRRPGVSRGVGRCIRVPCPNTSKSV